MVRSCAQTQEGESASSSPPLLFRSEFMQKPQMRVGLPGNCCQRLSVHSSSVFSCTPARGYLVKQKVLCTAIERYCLVPRPATYPPTTSLVSSREARWTEPTPRHGGLLAVLHSVLCPTVSTLRTLDLTRSRQCDRDHAAVEPYSSNWCSPAQFIFFLFVNSCFLNTCNQVTPHMVSVFTLRTFLWGSCVVANFQKGEIAAQVDGCMPRSSQLKSCRTKFEARVFGTWSPVLSCTPQTALKGPAAPSASPREDVHRILY